MPRNAFPLPGLDWGGVRREWFEILCVALFEPTGSGLFTRFHDDTQGLVRSINVFCPLEHVE